MGKFRTLQKEDGLGLMTITGLTRSKLKAAVDDMRMRKIDWTTICGVSNIHYELFRKILNGSATQVNRVTYAKVKMFIDGHEEHSFIRLRTYNYEIIDQ